MNTLTLWFHKMGSPPTFYRVSGLLLPWLYALALFSGGIGLYLGLFGSPADYLQGESVRILYIHVPSAWMSLFGYIGMAVAGLVGLVWRIKLAEIVAMACAPVGAAFTFVTLVSGSLWGRPTWGTYWVWDARLTSELVLLFLYFGVMGLHRAFDDPRRGARAASLLSLIGIVNIPIVHFSVQWWNTLHQGQSVRLMGESSIHGSMLVPLLLMAFATHVYFFASVFARARVALLEHESGTAWVRDVAGLREATA
jgi:heme exporter protein C